MSYPLLVHTVTLFLNRLDMFQPSDWWNVTIHLDEHFPHIQLLWLRHAVKCMLGAHIMHGFPIPPDLLQWYCPMNPHCSYGLASLLPNQNEPGLKFVHQLKSFWKIPWKPKMLFLVCYEIKKNWKKMSRIQYRGQHQRNCRSLYSVVITFGCSYSER